jgi:hypothetical protein
VHSRTSSLLPPCYHHCRSHPHGVIIVPRFLAAAPNGATEAILLAHGFTIEMLTILVRDRLATATPETVHAGKRPIEVVRVRITDAGRLALAG